MYKTQFSHANLENPPFISVTLLSNPIHDMGFLSIIRVNLFCFIFLIVLSSADLDRDKKECSSQLLALSSCIPFVGGKIKVPDPTCCSVLKKQINQSKKCLCLLVADRNDPDLGIKVNATLALTLPSICHAPSNASECPELLHLAPNSTEAEVFEQFAAKNSSSSSLQGTSTSGSNRFKEGEVGVWKILTWLLVSTSIIAHI